MNPEGESPFRPSGGRCSPGPGPSAPMAPLRFSANVSWLFTELPDVGQRLHAAAAAGFRFVEAAWLYDQDPEELRRVRREAGVEVVLINTPKGGESDLGLAAVPGREEDFKRSLDQTVELCSVLDCNRIHVMAGRFPVGAKPTCVATRNKMEEVFVKNLKYAADVLEKEGKVGLIEPINSRITEPRYFLDSPHQAAAILEKVGKSNIKLQMDVFHWQIMDGNLTENIIKYFPLIGHVQVSQVPHRDEPDSDGELNVLFLLRTLQRLGYRGYVGCEYKPRGATLDGLCWMHPFLQANTVSTKPLVDD